MRKVVSIFVLVVVIALSCQSVAYGKAASVPTNLRKAITPRVTQIVEANVVLPIGEEIGDKELSQVEGEGFFTALEAAAMGAFGAAISYTVDYVWDVYVDDSFENWLGEPDMEGDADNYRSWEWNEFYGSVVETAGATFIGGMLVPWP